MKFFVYGPTFLARGLVACLLVPASLIVFRWAADGNSVEIPAFVAVWIATWIISLLLTAKCSLQPVISVGLHALIYVGASSLLLYNQEVFVGVQVLMSCICWLIFDMVERLYTNYKRLNESMDRARVLEARIRPHFMFNILNNLRALTTSGTVLAHALEDSAALLRSALERTDSFARYCDERNFVEQYLRLESLRLDERLIVDWSVDENLEDYNPWMPGFILQPLVENAIRHGIERTGGAVHIALRHTASQLEIEIRNNWSAKNPGEISKGLGMAEKDIIHRLSLLYDAQASYKRVVVGDVCIVTIRFPWAHQ